MPDEEEKVMKQSSKQRTTGTLRASMVTSLMTIMWYVDYSCVFSDGGNMPYSDEIRGRDEADAVR